MKTLFIIIKYIPTIVQLIIAVEGALGSGNGAGKKQIVLAAIQAGAKVAEKLDEKHIAAIGQIIDAAVDAANKTGVFQTGTATPAVQ